MSQILKGLEQQMIRQIPIHKRKLHGDRSFVCFDDIEPPAISKFWANAFVVTSNPDIGGSRHR